MLSSGPLCLSIALVFIRLPLLKYFLSVAKVMNLII